MILIASALDASQIQSEFCPAVIRLSQSEWFFGKVSSCHLFSAAYGKASMLQAQLRKIFIELCAEDTPMVRRACAAHLGDFSTVLDKQHLFTEFIPVFQHLARDE